MSRIQCKSRVLDAIVPRVHGAKHPPPESDQLNQLSFRTPGHEVEENVNKGEGEVETATAAATEAPEASTAGAAAATAAPDTTAKIPSAAAPQPTELEQPVKEAEAAAAAPTTVPESLPEVAPEVAAVAHKDSLQEAVDKAQASKSGRLPALDGGDEEGAGML